MIKIDNNLNASSGTTLFDLRYLKLDGSNANVWIDIGSQNFTTLGRGTFGTSGGDAGLRLTEGSWLQVGSNVATPTLSGIAFGDNLTQPADAYVRLYEKYDDELGILADTIHLEGDVNVTGILDASSIVTPYTATYIISPAGGDYTTIQAALTAHPTENTLFLVYPGTYTNDTINFTANGQSVIGIGTSTKQIITSATAAVVNFAAYTNCVLNRITARVTAATSAIATVNGSTGSAIIDDCTIEMTNSNVATVAQPACIKTTGAATITMLNGFLNYTNNVATTAAAGIKTAVSPALNTTITFRRVSLILAGAGASELICPIYGVVNCTTEFYRCKIVVTDLGTTAAIGFSYINGAGGTGENYSNTCHVTCGAGAGQEADGLLAVGTRTIRSMFNYIKLAGNTQYPFQVDTGCTVSSEFDDIESTGASITSGTGVLNYINSISDGNLKISDTLNAQHVNLSISYADTTVAPTSSSHADGGLGSGSYIVGNTVAYRMYPYITKNGIQTFSTSYWETDTHTCVATLTSIILTFAGGSGATGYRLLRNLNGSGFGVGLSGYSDIASAASPWTDMNSLWTTGNTVTPNFPFTVTPKYNYFDGTNVYAFYDAYGYGYIGGKLGIGIPPTNDISFGGDASRIIQIARATLVGSPNGLSLTIGAGGALAGGTNTVGGNLILQSGISTGSGGSYIQFKPTTGTTGTTDRNPAAVATISGEGMYLGGTTTTPTAKLHLAAGSATAATAPIKFTSGAVTTVAVAGQMEYLTNDFYLTSATATREKIVTSVGLTTTRVPYATTNGRLTDATTMTFDGNTLSTGGLSVTGTVTATAFSIDIANNTATGVLRAGFLRIKHDPASASSADVYGLSLHCSTAGATAYNITNYFTGFEGRAYPNVGVGTTTYGIRGAFAFADLAGLGTVTYLKGLDVKCSNSGGGTVSNAYGIYLNAPTGTMPASGVNYQAIRSEYGQWVCETGAAANFGLRIKAYAAQTEKLLTVYDSSWNALSFFDSSGNLNFAAGINIIAATTTGTKIGTATSQLLGFYNATPVNQPDTVADPAGGATVDAEARTAINSIIDRLQELGLCA